MALTEYQLSISTDFGGVFFPPSFQTAVETALPVAGFSRLMTAGDLVSLWFDPALSGGDQTILDGVVAAHPLKKTKVDKIAAIDARTDQLIAAGFTYSGKVFSLSSSAQDKMIGSHQVKDDPALTYPIVWNNIDDTDSTSLADSAALNGFYLTALGTVRAHLDSGTALKDAVRAAADIAAVDAVVDSR